jgi:hypothetical protein
LIVSPVTPGVAVSREPAIGGLQPEIVGGDSPVEATAGPAVAPQKSAKSANVAGKPNLFIRTKSYHLLTTFEISGKGITEMQCPGFQGR